MPALQAIALQKTYQGFFGRGGQAALRGLELTVERGTAFGLIGPNGAGKTTFIKALLGVLRPSAGSVRVLGGDPEDPAIRARIGYLPERLQLPGAWTPLEFLQSVGRLKRLRQPLPEALRQLRRVQLADAAGRRIGGFSKGMKQRVGLAAALLGRPELLVLDEPTDGVDPLGRVAVRELLAEERARGATLFLNSHLLAETERICDRIGILAAGRLVREGTLKSLTSGAGRYLLRFAAGAPQPELLALGLSPAANGTFACDAPDPAALNELLARARAAGALLVELSRDEQDLEDVLRGAVEAAA